MRGSRPRHTNANEEQTIMKLKSLWLTALFGLIATPAFAEDMLNTGDTAWMIVSTALVMMMTPAGLALFYGGMSRYKNLLNTLARPSSPTAWPASFG